MSISRSSESKIRSFLGDQLRITVVGLGNEYRTDDGAGIAVIRLLKRLKIDKMYSVALLEAGRTLLGSIKNIVDSRPSRILFVDSAKMRIRPGDIIVLEDPHTIQKNYSTHENNLALVLAYLKRMMPECQILMIAIQFKSLDYSEVISLTEDVRKAVKKISLVIYSILKKGNSRSL